MLARGLHRRGDRVAVPRHVILGGRPERGRSTKPWTLAGKTMDPLAESGIGQGEGVRDGLQTLPFTTWRTLGTAEDAGFLVAL